MPRVTILTTGHAVTDARLGRHLAALRRAGFEAEIHRPLAEGSSRSARLAAALRAPLACDSDVVLVPDPELFLTVHLRRLRRRPYPLVVTDVHEAYGLVAHDRAWIPRWLRHAVACLARLAIRAAGASDLTVVADDHLPPRRAKRRMVVRNRPLASEFPPRTPDAEPRAVYVGDVRASRGLSQMLDAILAVPGWSLDLVGPIAPQDHRDVVRRAQAAGRGGDIRVHGRLAPTEAWAVAGGAWVGFALLDATPAFRTALPTKLYEYAAAGIPVVCSDLPRCRAFVERTGAGVVVQEPAEAAAILAGWSRTPSIVTALADAGRAWARKELAAPSDFDRFARALHQIVSDRSPVT